MRIEGLGETASLALYNGTILHGVQFLSPGRNHQTTTYYTPESGVGREILAIQHPVRRIGIIGLGVGTLAAYAKPGDLFRFYEINPLVMEVAKTNFNFLNNCEGTVELVPGDARIALGREAPQRFDLLALDAFDGRVIPVHLLTREAFALYAQHLAPEGVIAVHATSKCSHGLSNRRLDREKCPHDNQSARRAAACDGINLDRLARSSASAER